MNKMDIRSVLPASFQRALLGMIYPSIRAIAVGFDSLDKLTVCCYLDRLPNESDYENISEVTAGVLSDIEFSNVEEICIYADAPFCDLNSLDFWVYMRKE